MTFVSLLLRVSPLEAAKAIAREFGLPVDKLLTPEARRKLAEARRRAKLEREIEARFEAATERAYQNLCLLLRSASKTFTEAATRQDEATIEKLSFWLHTLPQIEDLLDRLYATDPAERLMALKEARRWTA